MRGLQRHWRVASIPVALSMGDIVSRGWLASPPGLYIAALNRKVNSGVRAPLARWGPYPPGTLPTAEAPSPPAAAPTRRKLALPLAQDGEERRHNPTAFG